MAYKSLLKNNYELETKCDAFFTGKYIQVTKEGDYLICESGDNVSVVSVNSGEVVGRIQCEEDFVTSVSLAPDNTNFVVALKSGNINQYEWPSRSLLRVFKSYHKGPITCMTWDVTSTLLFTGASDSSGRIWDIRQKFCTHSLKAEGIFRCVLFDYDLIKRPFAYAAVDNNIYKWKLQEGSSECLFKFEGHHGPVTSIKISSDSKNIISSGLDRVLILWSAEHGTNLRVVPVLDSISAFILKSPGECFPNTKEDDHIYAMTIGDKGYLSVWQVDTGKEVWKSSDTVVQNVNEDGVTLVPQMMYQKGLKSVIMTTYDNSIIFAHSENMTNWKQLSGYNEQILDCIFIGEEDSHLVVATNSPQLRLYNCKDKSCQFIKGHSAIPLSLSKHPENKHIFASSSHDNSIKVWKLFDSGNVTCIANATGHLQSVGCVAFGQGFIVSGSKDFSIKKWNFPTDLENSKSPTNLVTSHTSIEHDKDINSICVAVNNKVIATGSQDKTARVWDASTFTVMGILKGHKRGIWCVQFSPVDELLATASADAEIKIWSLSDYTNVKTLQDHDAGVLRLCWISHGLQLMSSASDGLIKLWTVKTGLCVQTFDQHEDKAWALVMSEDESKMVSGGEDSSLIFWKDVTSEEAEKAQEELLRIASEEQTLLNLIQQGKWSKALTIAIRLNQPHRGLRIVKEILDQTPEELSPVIHKLRDDQLSTLLQYAVQWNTKTKSSREAQSILHILLKEKTPEELESLPEWKGILEGFIPYTERHFKRVSALAQASTILNYMTIQLSVGVQLNNIPMEFQDSMHNGKDYSDIEENHFRIESEDDESSSDEEIPPEVRNSIMEVDTEESEDSS